ncbi:MAG: helix-turn-helix domain-containing protein [Nocardioidaceae bacterium]
MTVSYQERDTAVAGVVEWRQLLGPEPAAKTIMPDGCLDLIWDGRRLFVAGPDTTARVHRSPAGASYAALRFAGGTGPAFLGLAAHEVADSELALDQIWPASRARAFTERVAADPSALTAWALERARTRAVDPLGPRVQAMAATGTSIASMADRLSLSTRQLHRRCLPVFGYGPRRLARVLRLGRALEEARAGVPLAQIAAGCGYADQAHLAREVQKLAGTSPTRLLREAG